MSNVHKCNLILGQANGPQHSTDTLVASIGTSVGVIHLRDGDPLMVDTPEGLGLLEAELPGASAPRLEAGAGVAPVHVGVLVINTVGVTQVVHALVSRVPPYRLLLIIIRTQPLGAGAPGP